jgi:GTP-binding protein HflX
VASVLDEIGAGDVPSELVLNKTDLLDPLARRRLANRFPGAVAISAVTGEGLEELKEQIARRFADRFEDVRLLVPYDEGSALSALYALGAPIAERSDTEEGVFIRARLPHREVRRFAAYLIAESSTSTASSTR